MNKPGVAQRESAVCNTTEGGGSNPSPWTMFSHQKLGDPQCHYLERWVLNFYLFSIRLHHWKSSDDLRYFHDHPWWYWSWVLQGSYVDRSPQGEDFRKTHSLKFYPALHRHSVVIDKPCWTLLLTGPHSRTWGFWVDGRFRKRSKYFFIFGHHPCD